MPPGQSRRIIHASSPLGPYDIHLKTFLESNPHYNGVNVASFVFYPLLPDLTRASASEAASNLSFEPARLLLLQRNVIAEQYSDCCEIPWGACTLNDPTILESAKRVLFLGTGLHTERLLKSIGEGLELKNDEGQSLQLCFEIEVAEMLTRDFGVYKSFGDIPIRVDWRVIRGYVWVTNEDIRDDVYELVGHQSKDVILMAFRVRREAERLVRDRVDEASKAQKRRRIESNDRSGIMSIAGLLNYDGKEDPKEKEDEGEEEKEKGKGKEKEKDKEEEKVKVEEEEETDDESENEMERQLP